MSTSTSTIQGQGSMGLAELASGSNMPKAAIWQTTESKALELLVLDKITPHLGTLRKIRWGQITKQTFDEHPGVKDSDKLRLIFGRAMEIGKKDMVIKVATLLAKAAKYGEHTNSLHELWEWVNKKYGKSRERQQERLSIFTKENVIGTNVHPVDALEEVLWEYDFQWEDVESDAKVQNILLSAIRRDVNYVKVEELMERNPMNWKNYLDQEWNKHAASAFQRNMGYTRNWERVSTLKNGRNRRILNVNF